MEQFVMSENPNAYTPSEATELTSSTEVDFHAARPDLLSLDAARQARKLAEEALANPSHEEIFIQECLRIMREVTQFIPAIRAEELNDKYDTAV